MPTAQFLVNGLLHTVDYRSAMALLANPDHWLNAYPHGNGLPHGKIVPIRRQYAPVTAVETRIIALFPYLREAHDHLSARTVISFAFCLLVTLQSSELSALEYAIHYGDWFQPQQAGLFDQIVWSQSARPGSFAGMLPPEEHA